MSTDDELTAAPSAKARALAEGWTEERYDRDIGWRRLGFPEEEIDRSMVASIQAFYALTFEEGPPWYIFEPRELEIALSLTDAEKLRAHADAIREFVALYGKRGDAPAPGPRLRRYVRQTYARAVLLERGRPPQLRGARRGGSRTRRRSRVGSRARARSPGRSGPSEPEPPPLVHSPRRPE